MLGLQHRLLLFGEFQGWKQLGLGFEIVHFSAFWPTHDILCKAGLTTKCDGADGFSSVLLFSVGVGCDSLRSMTSLVNLASRLTVGCLGLGFKV